MSFLAGGSLVFKGPNLKVSASDVQTSFLSSCSFEPGTLVVIELGSKLQIDNATGLTSILLEAGGPSDPYDWELPRYDIPIEILGMLKVGPHIGLHIDGHSFVSTGMISFLGPDARTPPESVKRSVITNSTLTDDVVIGIEPGSKLELVGNSGPAYILLNEGHVVGGYDWELPDYGVPYRVRDVLRLPSNVSLTADGQSFAQSGMIVFQGLKGNVPIDSVRASTITNSSFDGSFQIGIEAGANLEITGVLGLDHIVLTTALTSESFDWALPSFGMPFKVRGQVTFPPTQGITVDDAELIGSGRLVFQGPNSKVPVESVRASLISNSLVQEGVDIGVEAGSRLSLANNQGIDKIIWREGSFFAAVDWTLVDYGVPYVVKDYVSINNGSRIVVPPSTELRFESNVSAFGALTVGLRNEASLKIREANLSGRGSIIFGKHSSGGVTNSELSKTRIVTRTDLVTITHNRFEGQSLAITTTFEGFPVILENDFINTVIALKNFNGAPVDVRNNYWGHASGPMHADNPTGQGGQIVGPVLFSPWATTPFTTSTPVEASELPDLSFSLESGYPNPFTSTAHLPFSISKSGHVRIAVYDLLGRRIADIVDGILPVGTHEAVLSARSLAPGTYLVVLSLEGDRRSQFVSVVR